MFVSSHINNKYYQVMSNYFYIAYLTNNIQNHKISIKGCGNLRKPHPSPELEASYFLRHFYSNSIMRWIKHDGQRKTKEYFKKFIGRF